MANRDQQSLAVQPERQTDRVEVDLNRASEKELADLPIIGPERARILIQHRPYRSWGDIRRVPGISSSVVDGLKNSGARIGSEETIEY